MTGATIIRRHDPYHATETVIFFKRQAGRTVRCPPPTYWHATQHQRQRGLQPVASSMTFASSSSTVSGDDHVASSDVSSTAAHDTGGATATAAAASSNDTSLQSIAGRPATPPPTTPRRAVARPPRYSPLASEFLRRLVMHFEGSNTYGEPAASSDVDLNALLPDFDDIVNVAASCSSEDEYDRWCCDVKQLVSARRPAVGIWFPCGTLSLIGVSSAAHARVQFGQDPNNACDIIGPRAYTRMQHSFLLDRGGGIPVLYPPARFYHERIARSAATTSNTASGVPLRRLHLACLPDAATEQQIRSILFLVGRGVRPLSVEVIPDFRAHAVAHTTAAVHRLARAVVVFDHQTDEQVEELAVLLNQRILLDDDAGLFLYAAQPDQLARMHYYSRLLSMSPYLRYDVGGRCSFLLCATPERSSDFHCCENGQQRPVLLLDRDSPTCPPCRDASKLRASLHTQYHSLLLEWVLRQRQDVAEAAAAGNGDAIPTHANSPLARTSVPPVPVRAMLYSRMRENWGALANEGIALRPCYRHMTHASAMQTRFEASWMRLAEDLYHASRLFLSSRNNKNNLE